MLNSSITRRSPEDFASEAVKASPRLSRRRSNRMGWLVVEGQVQGFQCNLRDYTDEGAQLTVSGLMGIPDTFSLFVEPDSIRYACRVILRKGNTVKVEFTEAMANNRYRDFVNRR